MPAMRLLGRIAGLGLAGRVVSLACVAIVIATLVQLVALTFLMRNQSDAQRVTAIESVMATFSEISAVGIAHGHPEEYELIVRTLAGALPKGAAGLYAPDGSVLAYAGEGGEAPTLNSIRPSIEGLVRAQGRYWRTRALTHIGDGEVIGYAAYSYEPPSVFGMVGSLGWRLALVLVLAVAVIAPFTLPVARRVLSPVTELEKRIRARASDDRSELASDENDAILKPLLSAIDEAHAKSEATAARAMRLAYSDPVTRLPNRLHLMSKLDAHLNTNAPDPLYFVICDLDGFSKLNVAMGPRVADEALAMVGQRLRECADEVTEGTIVLGRVGSDQFGVLLIGASPSTCTAFMRAAGELIAAPMTLDDHRHNLSCSFGAARSPDDAIAPPDLIKKAEIALKEAKRLSGDRAVLFDDKLLEKARRRSRMEAEVRRGIERGEFVAVYQPKIYLESGALAGAEALARWQRPDGALVSPGVFIPIAEDLGLIAELGRSVLRDACFAAAKWNERGAKTRIAVNVSPVQFDEPDFVESVERILEESGLDPQLLELEITESSAVSDPDRVSRTIWPLRERGVHLAIDDFGTGHSNFASITRLPFDVFKIDQQFIRGLQNDPTAPSIVEMILAMAETLGQETVAEGIETAEQAEFLLNRACTIGQGYYFSPPLPADEFDTFVRTWQPRQNRRFVA